MLSVLTLNKHDQSLEIPIEWSSWLGWRFWLHVTGVWFWLPTGSYSSCLHCMLFLLFVICVYTSILGGYFVSFPCLFEFSILCLKSWVWTPFVFCLWEEKLRATPAFWFRTLPTMTKITLLMNVMPTSNWIHRCLQLTGRYLSLSIYYYRTGTRSWYAVCYGSRSFSPACLHVKSHINSHSIYSSSISLPEFTIRVTRNERIRTGH